MIPTTTFAKSTVKLNKSKITLYAGNKDTLQLKNAKKVIWKSSNPQIAIVSSKGRVLAKKEGKCTITATDKQTNKKYTCKVTIPFKKIPVSLNANTPWGIKKGHEYFSYKSFRQYVLYTYGDKISRDAIYQPEDISIVDVSSSYMEPDALLIYKTGSTLLTVTSNAKVYTYQLDVVDSLLTYDDFTVSNISPESDEGDYAVDGKINFCDMLQFGHMEFTGHNNPDITTFRNIKIGSSLADVYKAYGCGSYTTQKEVEGEKCFVQYIYFYHSVNYRVYFMIDCNDKVKRISMATIN